MLIITSPTKTQSLAFEEELPNLDFSQPEFLDETEKINNILKNKSVDELQEALDISESLAEENFERYKNWTKQHTLDNSKPALFAYRGDVFQELALNQYNKEHFQYTQDSLRIITAFYGVLHGMSLMQPYRLEMKHKLDIGEEKQKMNKYWQEKLTEHFKHEADKQDHKYLLNLASNQYAKALNFRNLDMDVIDISFKEKRDGELKSIAIYIKKARGKMIDFCTQNKITHPEDLKEFSRDGYKFVEEKSEEDNLLFVRES